MKWKIWLRDEQHMNIQLMENGFSTLTLFVEWREGEELWDLLAIVHQPKIENVDKKI